MTAVIDPAARPAPRAAELPRVLARDGAPVDLAGHLARHGAVPWRGGPRLLAGTAEEAGLTGRGGAAFPVARKLRAVAEAPGRAVVVANGAEGEPASGKDRQLLWANPHLVLDGLQLAAEAVGAATAYLYVHPAPALRRRLENAFVERAAARCDRLPVALVEAPRRFLAGEESALAGAVQGGPGLPRSTPPRVFQRGVGGRPTLVQNVETLAHLALVARYGAAWFRAVGTGDEPGSMLVSLHDVDGSRGVAEVPLGTPLAELVDTGRSRAVLVGGYHGAWLPAAAAQGLPLANRALRPRGAAVGAGVVAALPLDRCGLVETARVVGYLARESAGQCGPCLNGLPRIALALGALAEPFPADRLVHDVRRWAGLVERRGACHHPDGTVRLVRSALQVFAEELTRHRAGRCVASRPAPPFLPLPAGPGMTS